MLALLSSYQLLWESQLKPPINLTLLLVNLVLVKDLLTISLLQIQMSLHLQRWVLLHSLWKYGSKISLQPQTC